MEISRVEGLEPYYDLYLEKNRPLKKFGFSLLPFEDFLRFQKNTYIIRAGDEEIGFFVKENDGFADSPKHIFSYFLLKKCLNNKASAGLRESFFDWVKKEAMEEAALMIEDYLIDETCLADNIFLKKDKYAIRLINKDMHPGPLPELFIDDVVAIRPFVIGRDEDCFVDIFNETFHGLCDAITNNDLQQWIVSPKFVPSCYLFAYAGKRLIGFIAIEINMQEERKYRLSYLQEIGVRREFQGKGIGSLLLNEGIKAAISSGSNRMGVGVLGSNKQALDFFKRKGFLKVYKKNYWDVLSKSRDK